jgi:hypothetical protein
VRRLIVAAVLVIAALIVHPLPADAGPRHPCFATAIKQNGPGLKNWRAYDPWCNGGGGVGRWFGPWRYTRGGAWIDAERHNSYND